MDKYIRHDQDDFADVMSELRPRGLAFPRDPDSVQMKIIYGLAGIWGIDFAGAADLFLTTESFPPYSINMLPDWENAFGLPDKCLAEPLSITDRHAALVNRMTTTGGQSRAFFIAEAASIGYAITITEYSPFQCGISHVGDTRGIYNPDDPTQYRWQLGPPEMRYFWTVHVNELRESFFHCAAGQCGIDPLLRIGLATDLECLIRRYKPGHTDVIFDYVGNYQLDFQVAYNSGYIPLITGF
jgi:uncharacterized protein YmfQ (DUF2313 family)